MQQTTNYNLKKIELTDSPPDITVFNPNFDTIDAEMKRQDVARTTHEADYTTFKNKAFTLNRIDTLSAPVEITGISFDDATIIPTSENITSNNIYAVEFRIYYTDDRNNVLVLLPGVSTAQGTIIVGVSGTQTYTLEKIRKDNFLAFHSKKGGDYPIYVAKVYKIVSI